MEEIAAEEAAKKAEEEKAKRTKNLGAISASTDEVTLLAALIQAESGNQPYEGQLAVGAVVMNRVRSGGYPNSIQGVIAQPGPVSYTHLRSARILSLEMKLSMCRAAFPMASRKRWPTRSMMI